MTSEAAVELRSCGHLGTEVTKILVTGRTPTTSPTRRQEQAHHMIANVQVSNAWSNFLDDAGPLVPTYQRDCERKVTLANVMVGVAQPVAA